MAQKNTVMAFRKRMKSFGYVDISIKAIEDGVYQISAVEPLAGISISVEYSLCQMQMAFRRVKGHVDVVYQDSVRWTSQMGDLPASNPES